MRAPSRLGRPVAAVAVLLLASAAPAAAQGDWLKAAQNVARRSAVGGTVARLATHAQMLDATRIDLERRGLPTVAVGPLVFGVAAVDVKNGEGVRVRGYLHNSTAQAAAVPVPGDDLFVLVDSRGRRLERVAGPDVQGVSEGAAEVTVPALERVEVTLLFAGARADASTATLKVGSVGMIPGIPVHTSAGAAPAAAAPAAAAGNVWTQAPTPPVPSAPSAAAPSTPTP